MFLKRIGDCWGRTAAGRGRGRVLSRGRVGRATEPRLAGSRGSRRIRVTPPPPDQDPENQRDYAVHETNTGLTTRQARVSASRSRPPKGAEGKDGSARQTLLLAPCFLKKEMSTRGVEITRSAIGDQEEKSGRRFPTLHGTSLPFPFFTKYTIYKLT
jgi:hypothetical protein